MRHGSAGSRRPAVPDSGAGPAKTAGRTPLQIADHNLRVTLEALRRDGPLTRLELGRRSGLTGPGITNILRRLSADGLITARKRADDINRQPSTEFAIRPDGAFSIGIRWHRRFPEAVLIDLSGRVRDRTVFEAEGDPATLVGSIVERFAKGAVADANIIGVGIAGEDPGSIGLDGTGELKLFAERDCTAAILAERTFGIGTVEGGLMFILLDDRIRAGLLLQGLPFRGVHGRAGSIGSMRTGADHVPLDSVVGLETLRAVLTPAQRSAIEAGDELPLTPVVQAWVRRAADHLLDAIIATAGFLAPGAILIGGDLPRSIIDALIERISVERADTATRPISTPWISKIQAGSLPGAGIAVGAALLPFFELLLPSPLVAA